MDKAFPFGLPGPTAFYLTIYVLTFVVHFLLAGYVLAGTAYVAVSLLARAAFATAQRAPNAGAAATAPDGDAGDSQAAADPILSVLVDWLPFATSGAITAGVAPLLFVQVLYQRNFYTANLLLSHRWMAIVPTLIVGFYLLYLLKARFAASGWAAARAVVGLGALACFTFTAWSWTENHLLSLEPASWPAVHASTSLFYRHLDLVPRLAAWCALAVTSMCVLVGWQLVRRGDGARVGLSAFRGLGAMAVAGLAGFAAFALVVRARLAPPSTELLSGPAGRPYLVALGAGAAAQVGCWLAYFRLAGSTGPPPRWPLWVATFGCGLTILATAVLREIIRVAQLDITKFYQRHADVTQAGGWGAFLVFAAVNAAMIVWCVRLVRPRATATESKVTHPQAG